MFWGIAQFAVLGRWQAAVMTALLSVAAMILPPVNYLASGVISLTTLRMGPREGVSVVVAALIVFALLAGLLLGHVWIAGIILFSSWLPVFLSTLALGYTRSLAAGILMASAVGIAVVVLQHIFLAEPAAWWFEKITNIMEKASQQGNWQLDAKQTHNLAVLMTAIIAAGVTVNAMFGVLLGRSWQARLDNQGAFASEFRELRLGKTAAVIAVIPMLLAWTPFANMLTVVEDCLLVVLTAFTIQGLAIVHAIVHDWLKNKTALILTYILLVVLPLQMMMFLSALAVFDQWFNFRKLSR